MNTIKSSESKKEFNTKYFAEYLCLKHAILFSLGFPEYISDGSLMLLGKNEVQMYRKHVQNMQMHFQRNKDATKIKNALLSYSIVYQARIYDF
jgi:hypothetical protein